MGFHLLIFPAVATRCFPAWVWLNVLLYCFAVSLRIVRVIYSFHSNISVVHLQKVSSVLHSTPWCRCMGDYVFTCLCLSSISFKKTCSIIDGLPTRQIFHLDLPDSRAWPGRPNFRFCRGSITRPSKIQVAASSHHLTQSWQRWGLGCQDYARTTSFWFFSSY